MESHVNNGNAGQGQESPHLSSIENQSELEKQDFRKFTFNSMYTFTYSCLVSLCKSVWFCN